MRSTTWRAALHGRTLQHVNSTVSGGRVAEILHWLVPLTEPLGINTQGDVMQGDEDFFEVTKTFYNGLQGSDGEISHEDFQTYLRVVKENARRIGPVGDVAIVDDPQPAY